MSSSYTSGSLARPAPSNRRRARKTDITEDQRTEAKEAFRIFDSRKTGTIDHQELRAALRALGFDVTKDEVHELLRRHGTPEGDVDLDGFIAIYTEKVLARDPIAEMIKSFALFDDDKTGYISLRNLRRVVKELGEDIPDSELQDMLDEFSSAGNGEVSQADFIAMLQEAANLI